MVFYLKYRPAKIDDLDSVAVRETLKSVLSKNEISHAFLFTGPKGLGKTSSARIIAKVVNCTTPAIKRKDKFEPCDECESCLSIMQGSNLDILEIDAASNRGIDEIRELKEKIRLAPVTSKKKVYIIDEVHMLTTEAFNALLKTLEEPPPHAMFVLATTEAHKIPATILSRCFHVGFKKATIEELVRSFERIAKSEKIDIDKKSLELIASISDGSFRDGVKVLEEISTLADKKKITESLIKERYKMISINSRVEEFIKLLKIRDTKKVLSLIENIVEQGSDIKYFTTCILEALHGELLQIISTSKPSEQDVDIEEIKYQINLISKAHMEIKLSVIPQLPLELAVIEYSMHFANNDVTSSEDVIQGQSGIRKLRRVESNLKKITAMYGSTKQNLVDEEEPIKSHKGVSLLHSSNSEVSKEWLDSFWKNLISEMKGHNHTIAGVLRGCRIERFDKENFVIETSFKFHKEKLDELKTRQEIARISKLLTGREMKVEVQLRNK